MDGADYEWMVGIEGVRKPAEAVRGKVETVGVVEWGIHTRQSEVGEWIVESKSITSTTKKI